MTTDPRLDDWPRDPEAPDRFLCTKERPMPKNLRNTGKWTHRGLFDAGECSEGCCDRYGCTNCGIYFLVELPQ